LVKCHIIHVGTMNNKGTQALLISDVSLLKTFLKDPSISVSTTDVEGVKDLNLPLEAVVPTIVDIPFKKADALSKRFKIGRSGLKYKLLIISGLLLMLIQVLLSLISALFIKMGLKPIYRGEVLKRMKDCDLVISCSDENFKESASLLPTSFYWIATWWSILFERTLEILMAKFFNRPVIMFPNSIGPFKTYVGRFLSKLALNRCDCLMLRDAISYKIAESLGINSTKILTADTALLLGKKTRLSRKRDTEPLIGVSPGVYSHGLPADKVNEYIKEHAAALDMAAEKYDLSIVFLPHYISGFKFDDLGISKLIWQSMENRERATIIQVNDVNEFKSLLEKVDMLISSKMHPAVLGVSSFVPTLCIAYDHKQWGLFNHLDMTEMVINIQEADRKTIFSKISLIWENRKEIKNLLQKKVPVLQKSTENSIREVLVYFTLPEKR